jgi:hypothetical protein
MRQSTGATDSVTGLIKDTYLGARGRASTIVSTIEYRLKIALFA